MQFENKGLWLIEDIDDFSDSIFGDEPLDDVEDKQTNEANGQTYVDDNGIERYVGNHKPVQHDIDKVTLSKLGEPMIGKHPVEYEYDDNDNLVAVDKVEKELSTSLSMAMDTVRTADKAIENLKVELKQEKDLLEHPNVNHYEVKQRIDSLQEKLRSALAKKKNAQIAMHSKIAQLDKYYKDKDKGEQ